MNTHSQVISPNDERDAIKVALIDDGVDLDLPEFQNSIVFPGWPRETPTSTGFPFYHSSTGHGTKMAKIINSACPGVRLYVAKLGDWASPNEIRGALAGDATAKNAADVRIPLITPVIRLCTSP